MSTKHNLDKLYKKASILVIKDNNCSTSYIQRKLAIGYNTARTIVEQLEYNGVIFSENNQQINNQNTKTDIRLS